MGKKRFLGGRFCLNRTKPGTASLPGVETLLGDSLLSAYRGLRWFQERLPGLQGQDVGPAVAGSRVAEGLGHQSS